MKRLCVFYKHANRWLGRSVTWIVCQKCRKRLSKGIYGWDTLPNGSRFRQEHQETELNYLKCIKLGDSYKKCRTHHRWLVSRNVDGKKTLICIDCKNTIPVFLLTDPKTDKSVEWGLWKYI